MDKLILHKIGQKYQNSEQLIKKNKVKWEIFRIPHLPVPIIILVHWMERELVYLIRQCSIGQRGDLYQIKFRMVKTFNFKWDETVHTSLHESMNNLEFV